MSRHSSRKERWTKLSAKEYRATFGVVCYRAGAWEGKVVYEVWNDADLGAWQTEVAYAGRFKRPRNAMISVEDKSREIARRLGEKVKVAIDP